MSLTPVAFAHLTHQLMSLAEGRVCVCLEVQFNYLIRYSITIVLLSFILYVNKYDFLLYW